MPERIVYQGYCPNCHELVELKSDGKHWVTLPHGNCAGGQHTELVHHSDGLGEAESVLPPNDGD